MPRTLAVLVLAAVCLGFTPAAAKAQPLRRLFAPQSCPTCPNGVCQPQPSGPMFASRPVYQPMPCFAAGQCPAGVCGAACPCPAGACPGSCPTTAAAPAAAPRYVFPRARGFFDAVRPHLLFR